MKKFLTVILVSILVFTLSGCDERVALNETEVMAEVVRVEEDRVFDGYDKIGDVQIPDYDDVLLIKFRYVSDLRINYFLDKTVFTGEIELDFEDDSWIIDYYANFKEGDEIPAIFTEKVYKSKEDGELYSKFSLEVDRNKIEN